MARSRLPGGLRRGQIHAHDYRGDEQFEGRDVVVVGAGTSAIVVSVKGSYRAHSVNLSIPRDAEDALSRRCRLS